MVGVKPQLRRLPVLTRKKLPRLSETTASTKVQLLSRRETLRVPRPATCGAGRRALPYQNCAPALFQRRTMPRRCQAPAPRRATTSRGLSGPFSARTRGTCGRCKCSRWPAGTPWRRAASNASSAPPSPGKRSAASRTCCTRGCSCHHPGASSTTRMRPALARGTRFRIRARQARRAARCSATQFSVVYRSRAAASS